MTLGRCHLSIFGSRGTPPNPESSTDSQNLAVVPRMGLLVLHRFFWPCGIRGSGKVNLVPDDRSTSFVRNDGSGLGCRLRRRSHWTLELEKIAFSIPLVSIGGKLLLAHGTTRAPFIEKQLGGAPIPDTKLHSGIVYGRPQPWTLNLRLTTQDERAPLNMEDMGPLCASPASLWLRGGNPGIEPEKSSKNEKILEASTLKPRLTTQDERAPLKMEDMEQLSGSDATRLMQGFEPETRNPEPETKNPKPETRNPKPETRNPKPETRPDATRLLQVMNPGLEI